MVFVIVDESVSTRNKVFLATWQLELSNTGKLRLVRVRENSLFVSKITFEYDMTSQRLVTEMKTP